MFSSRPTRAVTLAVIVLAIPFIVLGNRPLGGDVWWALAYAKVLVQSGQLPTADPFTFSTHIDGFVDAQWLSQLLFYLPYRLGDLPAVMAFNALTCTAALAIVLHAAWRRSGSLAAAATSLALIALPAFWFVYPRAQTLAFLPFAATYWLLLNGKSSVRNLAALAALEAIWANLHGSFFLAPLITAVVLTAHVIETRSLTTKRARFLIVAGLAQLAASFATPYGFDLYRYAATVSSNPVVRQRILEWLPTSAATADGVAFFATLGLTLAILARSRKRPPLLDVLLLGLFAALGIQALRNVIWFSLIATPLLAVHLAELRTSRSIQRFAAWLRGADRSRTAPLRIALIAGAALFSLPMLHGGLLATPAQQVDETYPTAAAEFLASHQYGPHLYADHYWSSFLDFRLYPHYQPMVDSAIEVHPPQVWLDFWSMQLANVSWPQLADQYDVDVLLLSREHQSPLVEAAGQSPTWQLVYADDQSVIYVRHQEEQA